MIKEVGTGEADKIITIFTERRGRVSALVRGGKRSKSKLSAGSQFMCYSEFVLYSTREDMYIVNSCEVLEPFYEIRNDIIKLTYAAHLIDIVQVIIQDNQPSSRLLQLLLNSLYVLAKTDKQPDQISHVFELRSLSIAGYSPHVRNCIVCGLEAKESYLFSFSKCGFICDREECSAQDSFAPKLSLGAVKAIQYIIYAANKEVFSFNISLKNI